MPWPFAFHFWSWSAQPFLFSCTPVTLWMLSAPIHYEAKLCGNETEIFRTRLFRAGRQDRVLQVTNKDIFRFLLHLIKSLVNLKRYGNYLAIYQFKTKIHYMYLPHMYSRCIYSLPSEQSESEIAHTLSHAKQS